MVWGKRTSTGALRWVRDPFTWGQKRKSEAFDPSQGTAVIFLDVDGVMNSKQTREKEKLKAGQTSGIDPVLLGRIAKIVKEAGDSDRTFIVATSTWRLEPDKWEEMTKALESKNLQLLDRTQDLESLGKGDRVTEIREWLIDNVFRHITSWIVIDDLDLIRMNDKLPRDHFVHTNDDIGITEEQVEEAVKKIMGIGSKSQVRRTV